MERVTFPVLVTEKDGQWRKPRELDIFDFQHDPQSEAEAYGFGHKTKSGYVWCLCSDCRNKRLRADWTKQQIAAHSTDNTQDLKAYIKQVKETLDLQEVAAAWYGMKLISGKASCPFHNDRSPSFSIYKTKNGEWRFRCFASDCAKKGDVWTFITLMEKREARK